MSFQDSIRKSSYLDLFSDRNTGWMEHGLPKEHRLYQSIVCESCGKTFKTLPLLLAHQS